LLILTVVGAGRSDAGAQTCQEAQWVDASMPCMDNSFRPLPSAVSAAGEGQEAHSEMIPE
jgi:hypothetical protein